MVFMKSHLLLAVQVFGLVKKRMAMSPWKPDAFEAEARSTGRGYGTSDKAFEYADGSDGMSGSPRSVLSPVAQHIFKTQDQMDTQGHLEKSMIRFNTVGENIDESIKKGRLIYVEDCETDDHWQSGITALGGIVPAYVFHRGGHEFVRKAVEEKVWDTFAEKFGIKRPIIRPIHATRPGEVFAKFDEVEGQAILDPEEIKRLQNKGRVESDESYTQRIQSARADLLDFLVKAEGPVTIALKTAPSGLAEIIKKVPNYKKKITIVWSAAIAMRDSKSFMPKFNFDQDIEAGHALLSLGLPIVLASPKLSNSGLVAIVDRLHMKFFNAHAKLKSRFEGFINLWKVVAKEGLVISSLFHGTQTTFMDSMAKSVADALPGWIEKREKLSDDISREVAAHGSYSDAVQRMQKQLRGLQDKIEGAERGLRSGRVKIGLANYQEYCAVDHFVEPVLNAEMRKLAVKEVIEVRLTADERMGKTTINATPQEGGNVFILSHIDSALLEQKIQLFIDWMLAGEPVLRDWYSRASDSVKQLLRSFVPHWQQ